MEAVSNSNIIIDNDIVTYFVSPIIMINITKLSHYRMIYDIQILHYRTVTLFNIGHSMNYGKYVFQW